MTAAILLAAAVAVSPNAVDPDLWGHVRYGRDLLRDGLPETATYTYTAVGHPWVNHENLAEAVMALGADTLGPRGLLIGKCLIGVAIIGLIVRQASSQKVSLLVVGATALLVATNLSYHWSVRPQVLGFLCFALLVALVTWCFDGWAGAWRLPWPGHDPAAGFRYSSRRLRMLWLAPLIFVLWTNAHGGFLAGLCIYTVYLASRSLEAWTIGGRQSLGVVMRLALMALVAWLAALVNPYGPTLLTWLVADIWAPRPEILDWRPPGLFDPLYLPLWIMAAVTAVSLAVTKRSRDFTHLVLLAATFWQAIEHQRHIPFFAILFGFWMPSHLDSLLGRWTKADNGQPQRRPSPVLQFGFGALLLGVFVLLGAKLAARLTHIPVPADEYPLGAAQFISDHNLRGKAVVAFNWAQYAIEAVGPASPKAQNGLLVACDGRLRTCYPQEIIDYHFDFTLGAGDASARYRDPASPAFDPAQALRYGAPDLALIDRRQPHSVGVMASQSGWSLLYQDGLAQLWGRSSVFDDPDSPQYLPPKQRSVSDSRPRGQAAWPALPTVRNRPSLAISP